MQDRNDERIDWALRAMQAELGHKLGVELKPGWRHGLHRRARDTRSWTCWIMVFPWIFERGFPGRRVEPKRAGMIATMAKSFGALVYEA